MLAINPHIYGYEYEGFTGIKVWLDELLSHLGSLRELLIHGLGQG